MNPIHHYLYFHRKLAFAMLILLGSVTQGANAMPISVPAKIQAEDYVNALDTTSGNTGGAYKNDNVDIQVTSDTGGGYNIGWIAADEWLEYAIQVPQTGSYTVDIRLASRPGGGRYQIQLDGANAGLTKLVDATGGWQNWVTQTVELGTVSQGSHSLRLYAEAGSFNLNWLEVKALDVVSTAVPGRLEAENYQRFYDTTAGNTGGQLRSDNVDIGTTSDGGGGHVVGWIAQGEWLEYDINVGQAGSYDVDARVASATDRGAFSFDIDGDSRGPNQAVPNTGGWNNWTTLSNSLGQLSAGNHTVRVNMDGSSFNLNWLDLKASAVTSTDQCDTTDQCKAIYGNGATDCQDSQSAQSICMCGSQPCDSDPNPDGEMLGQFDKSKDLFLAFFDNKPDADDIHSQAGVATLLADSRFDGVNFYSVLGTYGRQNAAFLNSTSVMNACLGSTNWSNAHPKDGSNWSASIDRVVSRAEATFEDDGDIWIMEAGQSDFTADLVRRLKSRNSSLNTRARVHVVQHSDWNENNTTPADFSYVKDNTDYNRIPDGNRSNNGSPQFKTDSSAKWSVATSIPGVGSCWAEARQVANENNYSGDGHFNNSAIEAGGFDFSDVTEATWIFGFNSLQNQDSFFDEFPR